MARRITDNIPFTFLMLHHNFVVLVTLSQMSLPNRSDSISPVQGRMIIMQEHMMKWRLKTSQNG